MGYHNRMPSNRPPAPCYLLDVAAFKQREHLSPTARAIGNFMVAYGIVSAEMAFRGPFIIKAAIESGYLTGVRTKRYGDKWFFIKKELGELLAFLPGAGSAD
jgi:hypothetical protein